MQGVQEVLLDANAVATFVQLLKVPSTAGVDLAQAAADAAVVLGLVCSGRPVHVAAATSAGCLPPLLTMLRSTQVISCACATLSPLAAPSEPPSELTAAAHMQCSSRLPQTHTRRPQCMFEVNLL